MKIILSPAKRMRIDTDTFPVTGMPVFLDRAKVLRDWILGLSPGEQKKLWAASDAITEASRACFAEMDLAHGLTPAILSYDGIQYTCLAPAVLEETALAWVQEHVRILSGFYGVLRPFDGVVPYRLEMQAKGTPPKAKSLYDYWGDALYQEVTGKDRVILNLFGELEEGELRQKGVYAKMARGEMVRYLAGIGAQDPEEAKGFALSGYRFNPDRSTETAYVFERTGVPGKMGEKE